MRRLMSLARIIIVLVISYFLFTGKFNFTSSQAYGLIFLLVIVIMLIGWNSYAENKSKFKFQPHHLGITIYLKPILHEIGLSENKIKEFFKTYEDIEKGKKIINKNIYKNASDRKKGQPITKDDIYITSKLTENNGVNYSVINLLDSGKYLMIDNNAEKIGGAFTTNLNLCGRINIIEGMPYTDIYIIHGEKGYEIGLVDLDTEEYSMMGKSWETEVFYHKERCKILGIIPYELIHHQRSTMKQYQKASKILEKYNCELEIYEGSSYYTINNNCFKVNYGLIDD